MTAGRYRKKPVVIEAFQWVTGERQIPYILDWVEEVGGDPDSFTYDGNVAGVWDAETQSDWGRFTITTLEGEMTVSPRDFIIRGVQGEFYACKPDIFAESYEAANDD